MGLKNGALVPSIKQRVSHIPGNVFVTLSSGYFITACRLLEELAELFRGENAGISARGVQGRITMTDSLMRRVREKCYRYIFIGASRRVSSHSQPIQRRT